MATRADLDRFLQAEGAPTKGSALATALEMLTAALLADGQELDFLAVKAAARKVPRVAAQRLEWVRTMGLDAALARHLPPGTLDDGCAEGVVVCDGCAQCVGLFVSSAAIPRLVASALHETAIAFLAGAHTTHLLGGPRVHHPLDSAHLPLLSPSSPAPYFVCAG